MTQKDSTDFDPKHRIIGAIILVALAVIFVPIILDRSGQPETTTVSNIPAPSDQTENKVVVVPVTPPVSTAGPVIGADPNPTADAPTEKPASTETPPATAKAGLEQPAPAPRTKAPSSVTSANATTVRTKEPAVTAKAAPKPVSRPADVKNGWVVQVGTFANAANANRLQGQLQKLGHKVNVDRINRGGSNSLRLRVGPFRDRALAVKAQGQIQRDTGVQGVVLAYP